MQSSTTCRTSSTSLSPAWIGTWKVRSRRLNPTIRRRHEAFACDESVPSHRGPVRPTPFGDSSRSDLLDPSQRTYERVLRRMLGGGVPVGLEISVRETIDLVCVEVGVVPWMVESSDRHAPLPHARQLIAWLLSKEGFTAVSIASAMGRNPS